MSKNTLKIFDLHFWAKGKKEILNKEIFPALEDNNKKFIVTVNPEIVMKSLENQSYKNVIKSADYIVPDGVGVNVAIKKKYSESIEIIPGIELMEDLLKYANEHEKKCFFYGAKQAVGDKMLKVIFNKYPKLKVVGYQHGYLSEEEESLLEIQLRELKPDLVFVALGYPKQEEWISQVIDKLDKGVFMGVGGSFDVLSGTVKRAPLLFRKLHLEWFYRMLSQPSRLFRVRHLFKYVILLFKLERNR